MFLVMLSAMAQYFERPACRQEAEVISVCFVTLGMGQSGGGGDKATP